MHEPTLLPPDPDTRRRRGLIVAVLTAAVLATGLAGWLLFTSASGSLANSDVSQQPNGVGGESTGSTDARAPAATGTTRLRLTSDLEIAASASYSFAEPIDQIWLTVPTQSDAAQEQGFAPVVDQLRVTVRGRPERHVPGGLVDGDRVSVPLPAGTTNVHLDYLTEGVVVRSVPSSNGRALALLTPLEITSSAQTTNLVIIKDSGVLNLGCEVDDSTMMACGLETDAGWQVAVDSAMGSTRVLAGVDLNEQ